MCTTANPTNHPWAAGPPGAQYAQIDTQLSNQTRQEFAGILKNLSWVEAYSTPMMEEDLFLLARQPVKKSVQSYVQLRAHTEINRLRELCSSKVACLSGQWNWSAALIVAEVDKIEFSRRTRDGGCGARPFFTYFYYTVIRNYLINLKRSKASRHFPRNVLGYQRIVCQKCWHECWSSSAYFLCSKTISLTWDTVSRTRVHCCWGAYHRRSPWSGQVKVRRVGCRWGCPPPSDESHWVVTPHPSHQSMVHWKMAQAWNQHAISCLGGSHFPSNHDYGKSRRLRYWWILMEEIHTSPCLCETMTNHGHVESTPIIGIIFLPNAKKHNKLLRVHPCSMLRSSYILIIIIMTAMSSLRCPKRLPVPSEQQQQRPHPHSPHRGSMKGRDNWCQP